MPFTSSIFTFWWETQSHPYRPATPNRFRWGTGTTRAVGPGNCWHHGGFAKVVQLQGRTSGNGCYWWHSKSIRLFWMAVG